MLEPLENLKNAISLYQVIPQDEWNAFSNGIIFRNFKKGDFLIETGKVENFIFFLNKGTTRNYFLKGAKEFTVDFHFKGDFVTAYLSFITREPSPITIEFLEDAETVAIPYQHLKDYYTKSSFGANIGRLMAETQYVRRLRKEMELLSLTAEERYENLMRKNPKLVGNISVKHLSSYLGIHPESLSRIRKQYVGK
jgi:CRP/FNR family transcriptional regulator, anaerobic regulatory protein